MVRRRTGRGQHVDVSGAECMNSFGNGQDIITYADTGYVTHRNGIRTPIQYPYTILPCKDGYFAMIIAKETHWQKWLDLMGRPAWTENPRYQDRTAMGGEYPEEVDELIKPFLARHTKQELWRMWPRERHPLARRARRRRGAGVGPPPGPWLLARHPGQGWAHLARAWADAGAPGFAARQGAVPR